MSHTLPAPQDQADTASWVGPANPDEVSSPRSWRNVLPIHPAAKLFPPMSPDELRELGEDIQKNGQRFPVAIINDPPLQLLIDGCNRLDAMEAVGIAVIDDGELSVAVERVVFDRDEIDPYDYVISTNVRRRHHTAEQNRELTAKLLKARPEWSNRQIAKTAKVDHKTVGAVRDEQEARGEIPHVATRTDAKGRRQPARRDYSPHRAEKLGDATVDKLQGTSLASAREMDDLVRLNRGAPEGEHTEIVKRLVASAEAGKNVSATALVKNGVHLEAFLNSLSFVRTACATSAEVEIPQLDKKRQSEAIAHLQEAITALNALRRRLKGSAP